MFMSIEQLLLIEKQRRQQEADLVRTLSPEQKCFEEKKAGVKLSQWFGSILVRTGAKILQYAN